jgi:hypothetical protein
MKDNGDAAATLRGRADAFAAAELPVPAHFG